ncbi:hypothetical protein ACP70R_028299 [Stipagrostis hirtigluma subsp. patula]
MTPPPLIRVLRSLRSPHSPSRSPSSGRGARVGGRESGEGLGEAVLRRAHPCRSLLGFLSDRIRIHLVPTPLRSAFCVVMATSGDPAVGGGDHDATTSPCAVPNPSGEQPADKGTAAEKVPTKRKIPDSDVAAGRSSRRTRQSDAFFRPQDHLDDEDDESNDDVDYVAEEDVQARKEKSKRVKSSGAGSSSGPSTSDRAGRGTAAGAANPVKKKANRSIVCRCTPGIFHTMVGALTNPMKEIIRNMGFGGLLDMKPAKLKKRDLLVWLMDRMNPETMTLEIVGGKTLKVDEKAVRCVLGLPSTGTEDPPSANDPDAAAARKDLAAKLVDGNVKNLLPTKIAEKIRRKIEAHEEFDTDFGVRLFFMVAFCTILFCNSDAYLRIADVKWMIERTTKDKPVLCGCGTFLMYDSSLDPFVTPRITQYDYKLIENMTDADQRSDGSGDSRYGNLRLKTITSTCYQDAAVVAELTSRGKKKHVDDILKKFDEEAEIAHGHMRTAHAHVRLANETMESAHREAYQGLNQILTDLKAENDKAKQARRSGSTVAIRTDTVAGTVRTDTVAVGSVADSAGVPHSGGDHEQQDDDGSNVPASPRAVDAVNKGTEQLSLPPHVQDSVRDTTGPISPAGSGGPRDLVENISEVEEVCSWFCSPDDNTQEDVPSKGSGVAADAIVTRDATQNKGNEDNTVEEAPKRRKEEEEAEKNRKEEEEAANKRKEEEEAAKKMKEDEEAAKKREEEEAAKRKNEEAAKKRKEEEEAAMRKKQEQEEPDKRKQQQQQEEARKKKQHEEEARKKKQQQEDVTPQNFHFGL